MALKRIAIGPLLDRPINQGNPFVQAALHLHHVGDRVDRPQVIRVQGNGPAAKGFGLRIIATFFERKGQHAEDEAVTGDRLVPQVEHAGDGIANDITPTGPERRMVVHFERQQVVRMVGQDGLPGCTSPFEIAGGQPFQGVAVQTFAAGVSRKMLAGV